MQSYQEPPRGIETVFCRRRPIPLECIDAKYFFNPELPSVPVSSFEVKVSGAAKKAGRGVYSTVDIPLYAYIAPLETTRSLRFSSSSYKIIVDLYEEGPIDLLLRNVDPSLAIRVYRQHECVYFYATAYGLTNRKHVSLPRFHCLHVAIISLFTPCAL